MPRNGNKILGINPHSRYIGIAILYGTQLREWMIKNIREDTPNNNVQTILTNLISRYNITGLAIKRIHSFKCSKKYKRLLSQIENVSVKNRIPVTIYSLDEIKSALLHSDMRMNKKCLMEVLLQRFPVLFREHEREQQGKNPYHVRMFEAVAVALVHHNKLDKKSKRS